MGLRTKTALVIAGIAAIVAALIGLLVHHRTADQQHRDAAHAADAQLVQALQDRIAGVDSGALVNPPDLPAALRATVIHRLVRATYLQDPGDPKGPVMWAAARSGDDILAVRRSYAPQAEALQRLDQELLGSGAAAVALGCGLGIAVAAAAGRRIGASARTAQRISGGDLTARVTPKGKDEIARLGEAVNTMADALSARLEAERRVTADIAHELRTPVAGLVTAVDLLPPGRPAELVRGGVDQLRRLVEDVLEVARLDVPGVERAQREEVRLGELTRRAAAATGREVEVRVRRDEVVQTDPRRVERILANLVTNACRHGAPPVVLEVDGTAVHVSDHGPGFPADLLAEGPQRFRTGARERGTGIGLGLTIVMGQAQVLGAEVTYENPPEGGARATLDLAPRRDRPA
ncbi:histidine kinase [Streptomyces cellostaticus]|uniref:histidine kinase n=1 Tax=Streptomyces cellostaticus TaxID=67285 RepID=A0A117PU79_9ACTN|nr:HAMP domain-containing sensor histidine kinase [Streptomyces cellostaticus]KUM91700.1 histidine kinase [Streptomyces cellostaticus]GHI04166.1 sensor protein CseC [Streptomyces cellostaticus]